MYFCKSKYLHFFYSSQRGAEFFGILTRGSNPEPTPTLSVEDDKEQYNVVEGSAVTCVRCTQLGVHGVESLKTSSFMYFMVVYLAVDDFVRSSTRTNL